MQHPGPLIAAGALDLTVEPGAATALDAVAEAADSAQAFLRAAWFTAAAEGGDVSTLVARRAGTGVPVAALPLAPRRIAGMAIMEVPGSYWPWRTAPIASDASDRELETLLSAPAAKAALGRAWRIGPVYADDPAAARLAATGRRAGWRVLARPLGTCFMIDLERLAAHGPWPSVKTLHKNRWFERRLAKSGELGFTAVTGDHWCAPVFDTLAAIEGESWHARAEGGKDTKFLNPSNRRIWECAVADPVIAERLSASILTVGGEPAAFSFTLRAGETLHVIANSYSERFADSSPGRILLYREFQRAAEAGIGRIGWGAGDPGYKSQMGATPGPAILDLLFVRGLVLGSLAKTVWR